MTAFANHYLKAQDESIAWHRAQSQTGLERLVAATEWTLTTTNAAVDLSLSMQKAFVAGLTADVEG